MSTQTLYEITDWNRRYENNRSRLVEKLSWVPIPNAHDGENYSRLMTRKDSAVVFAAWILILQVASRCSPRGSLIRTNGEPHDPESLSLKTRAPASWFNAAIPPLIQYGWLSRKSVDINQVAPERQMEVTLELGDRHAPALEGNGKKGIEIREGAEAAKPRDRNLLFDALCLFENTPVDQVGKAAGRIAVALRDIKAASPDVTPGEIARRGENYKTLFTVTPTANGLASHWGKCHEAAPKRGANGQIIKPDPRETRPVKFALSDDEIDAQAHL